MSDLEERPQAEDETGKVVDSQIKRIEHVGGLILEKIKQILSHRAGIAIAASCLIIGIVVVGNIQYNNIENLRNTGYAVKYQGKTLGFVRDKKAAIQALSELKEEVRKHDQTIVINDDLYFDKVIVEDDKVGDAKQMVQTLAPEFYSKYTSYAISINGAELAIVKSEEEAKKIIEDFRKYYETEESKTGAQVLSVILKDELKVTPKIVDDSKLVDAKTVLDKLLTGKGVTKKYEVKSGDSMWRIAANNNMEIEQIMAVNPGVNPERLQIGQLINLSVSEPYINVEATIKAVYDENIPYETTYVNDTTLYKGQTRVVKQGEYGLNKVEKKVTKLNGKEIASAVLSTVTAKSPVIRILARGTKELIGSGRFLWPLNGSITSAFGSRGGGYHTGIDIGAPYGTPIAAADSGTVIYSGWRGTYGKLVMVDHGNGYVTYYAHCSSIYVNSGETVKKGQQVGAVGTTGRVTGPHLHFEVRLNGSVQNPLTYLR